MSHFSFDIQHCGETGTESVRTAGTYSSMDGSSDMANQAEGLGSSYPYRSASRSITSSCIKRRKNTFRL